MITSDSFYMIHKDLLAEISRIFERYKSLSRGGARKGSLKTGLMLFGACNIAFYPVYPHESVIFHASRLCCEIPISGGRVFERGDVLLLEDHANKGMVISSLETGVIALTVSDVSFCIPLVPIIVVFTKYDQVVIRKKCALAQSLGTNVVEWECRAKETAMEAVRLHCEKPLYTVARIKHRWTEVSSVYYWLDDLILTLIGFDFQR
jgi:hypothetical protein